MPCGIKINCVAVNFFLLYTMLPIANVNNFTNVPVCTLYKTWFRLCISWGWIQRFYPRPVLAFGYCRCLRLCVRPSVPPSVCAKHLLVRAITQHAFKLGSPNLDNWCKRPWLRSLLFLGVIDLDFQGQIELQSQNLPHFELVHAITHHQLKLQFPNLEQKCILALFRSLPILGLIEIDLQKKIQFLISNPDQIELFMYIIGIL